MLELYKYIKVINFSIFIIILMVGLFIKKDIFNKSIINKEPSLKSYGRTIYKL